MSTTTTETKEVKPTPIKNPPVQEKSNTPFVVVLVLLGLFMVSAFGIGYMFWEENERLQIVLYQEKKKSDEMEQIRKKLDEELTNSRTEINSYLNRTAELDELVNTANAKLDAKQRQINVLVKNKANVASFEKQLIELTGMNEEFKTQIASLSQELEQLKTENNELKVTIATLESEKATLSTKVDAAATLKAYAIKAESMQHKKGDKYVFTDKAKRTDRISISFELPENPVAVKGAKEIHLLIISPNGNILSDAASDQPTFTKLPENKESAFTRQKPIEYTGEKQKIFFNWDKSKGYLNGIYKVEIYLDGMLIGNSEFTIK